VAEVESQGGGAAHGEGKECFWVGHAAGCEPGNSEKGRTERTGGSEEKPENKIIGLHLCASVAFWPLPVTPSVLSA